VDDLVEGMIRMMDTADDVTGPINLGNPAEISVRALAERVIALTGSASQLVFKPLPQDDPRQRQPDIALAERVLDWRPTTALDDGLTKTIGYFRDLIDRGMA
jgi:UDP-glucuronate decarboxylase